MTKNKNFASGRLLWISVILAVLMLCCIPALSSASSSIGGYNVYYGILHNHSNVSDGKGTPAQAYAYARDTAGLDFFSLADHAEQISSSEWTNIKNTANSYNADGKFVTFWGFEWSSPIYGHVSVFNTQDYCMYNPLNLNTNTFRRLCNWLNSRDCIAFMNHPGREDTFGQEFYNFERGPYSDKVVGMELWNKNNGFDEYYYNDGYKSNDGNKGYYDEALTLGWKIGAAGSDDNHDATWGTRNDYRLAVLAAEKTRASIYEALKSRRFFSTLDKNISLSFKIGGNEMGSVIPEGTYVLEISASDADSEIFTQIQLIKNGAVAEIWNPGDTSPVISSDITTGPEEYYYVKVTQADGDEAISSPIFVE
ncbi:uncharacterized protein DUF3604 [Anaerobacterium chartisolvens]|uniref:Uncharacterized protein DUF3604 n=1 Tax=Anaerobacterium chartisolvens TaxID=1297424 RepID=A0A369BC79_9FIRM|nr:CehA/McbA family metallohydrolase [Anaerobacterium chartisolvens]RCX17264.1 uncharacterized protein DUF3604 [Anaerobacterium chartisolvens]